MSNLSMALDVAIKSLMAQQGALETTSNNIANINTPGYSRQLPIFVQDPSVQLGDLWLGTGASLDRIQSVRDQVLERRLDAETQEMGRLDAYLGSMLQVEAEFNETAGVGLEGELSGFFNALQDLSTNPSNLALRQAVISSGENLALAFRRTATSLGALQQRLDGSIAQSVEEINGLTSQIAELNRSIAGLEGTGREDPALVDRRNLLIRELSELVDVSVIPADNSLTVTTANGTPLVVTTQSLPLEARVDPSTGFNHIFSQDVDITASITAGRLGGYFQARDQSTATVLADLDTLASDLANAFNAAHQAGFDLSGAAGGDFFVPPPVGGVGAAASFTVALSDPSLLAASADGTPGSNGNLETLIALRNGSIVSGQSPSDFYVSLLTKIGTDVATAKTNGEATVLILRQLENQRSALSGVSLDEEAANLIRFQQAFQAAARVVTTIDELMQTVINM